MVSELSISKNFVFCRNKNQLENKWLLDWGRNRIYGENDYKGAECGDPAGNLSKIFVRLLNGSPPSRTNYPTSLILICMPGYKWLDNSLRANISCQLNGIWTNVDSCWRMDNFIY